MNSPINVSFFLIALASCLVSCKQEQGGDNLRPQLSDITESVYASAKVVPDESYLCRTSRSGIIQEIYVKEGDLVKKGQTLFRISPTPDVQNRVQNAEINLREAQNNYRGENNLLLNITSEIQTAKDKLQIDSINYARKKRLRNQSIGSESELENSLLAYQSSRNQLTTLQAKYEQTKANLKNQVEKAQSLASAEKRQLSDFEVKAIMQGKIFSIDKQVGEYINPQENFGEIGSASSFIIEMNIDEVDISKVSVGDTAIIDLEAYPHQVFTSIINYISDKKQESTQTFKVESIFTEDPSKLYHGLSGEANIIVSQRQNVIIIPSEYLINGNKVQTASGEREVQTGIRNLEFVEITEGIDTATILIKPL